MSITTRNICSGFKTNIVNLNIIERIYLSLRYVLFLINISLQKWQKQNKFRCLTIFQLNSNLERKKICIQVYLFVINENRSYYFLWGQTLNTVCVLSTCAFLLKTPCEFSWRLDSIENVQRAFVKSAVLNMFKNLFNLSSIFQ